MSDQLKIYSIFLNNYKEQEEAAGEINFNLKVMKFCHCGLT